MRKFCTVLLLWLAVVESVTAAPSLTCSEYRAELNRLLAATEKLNESGNQIPELLNSLPPAWEVKSARGSFSISTEWLRRDLDNLKKDFDVDLRDEIHDRLDQLRVDLDAYEEPRSDDSKQREQLASILGRSEFSDLHGPTWTDRLKQRFVLFLIRMLGRAITSSIFSTMGTRLVYGLMVLALIGLVYMVYRSIRRSTEVETILPESLPVSARAWTIWLAEAREAAQRGNWRDAVHLAYWAGIAYLESQGAWRPDSARTPREYLRLMPAANEHRAALTALTRKFELVWYAGQPADEQSFSQAIEELEKFGCRLL